MEDCSFLSVLSLFIWVKNSLFVIGVQSCSLAGLLLFRPAVLQTFTHQHTHTHTHLPAVRKWGKSVIKISRVVLKILIKKILGYIGTMWGNETCFSYGLVTMLVLLYSVFNLAAISLQKNHSLFHFFFCSWFMYSFKTSKFKPNSLKRLHNHQCIFFNFSHLEKGKQLQQMTS